MCIEWQLESMYHQCFLLIIAMMFSYWYMSLIPLIINVAKLLAPTIGLCHEF